jgi:hypothetical protein
MSRLVEVVTLTADQVRALIDEAVAKALDDQRRRTEASAKALSAVKAARLAGCRDGYLLAALNAGALKGCRTGKRWAVLAGDVATWVAAGKPLEL